MHDKNRSRRGGVGVHHGVATMAVALCCVVAAAAVQTKPARAFQAPISRRPRAAAGLRSAQAWLEFYWRDCRKQAYPQDPEVGADKVTTSVRFVRKRRRAQARLTTMFHAKGKAMRLKRVQKTFIRCVRRRLQRKWLVPHGLDYSTDVALTSPFPSVPFVKKGALQLAPAKAYLAAQMAEIEPRCGLRRHERRGDVIVGVDQHGRVTSIDIDVRRPRAARCVRRRIRRRLRFPRLQRHARVRLER